MEAVKNRCCKKVYTGNWLSHQCSRKGVVCREGKYYCNQHDPIRITKENRKKEEAWRKRHDEQSAEFERTRILLGLAKGIPTEELELYELILIGA